MIFPLIQTCKLCIQPLKLRYCHIKFINQKSTICRRFVSTSASLLRITQDEAPSDSDNEALESDRFIKSTFYDGYARDLLYNNSKDLLLQKIYSSASVNELLSVLEANLKNFKCEHMTLTVFVLNDLFKIYQDVSALNSDLFFEKLSQDKNFQNLLELIENDIDSFDLTSLSYCTAYLNKLGLSTDSEIIQTSCLVLKKKLLNNFHLTPATNFVKTVFDDLSLRSYFMVQELVPLILAEIDNCQSVEAAKNLTICLNKLHNLITDETLEYFKLRIEKLIQDDVLKSKDYKVILHIIQFLNYPKWREKNSGLLSKCILLIRKNLNELSAQEIILLYEIFFITQEPACILNDLQRCSYKYLHELDDFPTPEKTMLFFSTIFFTSTHLRKKVQLKIESYVKECTDFSAFLVLGKILSYVKTSDVKICNLYWSKALKFLKTEKNIDVLKLSQNYVNFSCDGSNYRHKEFEKTMLKHLSYLSEQVEYQFFPQKITSILNFHLMFGTDLLFLDFLVNKLEQNYQQFKAIDCLKISYTLKLFNDLYKKNFMKLQFAHRIDNALEKFINKEITNINDDLWKNHALLKTCLYKNSVNTKLAIQLLENYKNFNYITSKNVESIYFCFIMTNSLIPQVLDNVIEYIITYKNNVLGFNVARILYLCYSFGYFPKNVESFCEVATNILIRDHERMSGLLLIYSALALCFYNRLPNSVIQSIFNAEFMDKLDNELEQCYSKDKYPQRVRNGLMQLNRAVCLEYPESNVPWFHQKYVNENLEVENKYLLYFSNKVSEYFSRIVPSPNDLGKNVVTPYGYTIDFLIGLDSKDEIVNHENNCVKRLAFLLIPEHAFTSIVPQLKGSFQLKRRHLEILGYKVIFIRFSDWISLFYAEERIDFLRRLIWPKTCSEDNKDSFS